MGLEVYSVLVQSKNLFSGSLWSREGATGVSGRNWGRKRMALTTVLEISLKYKLPFLRQVMLQIKHFCGPRVKETAIIIMRLAISKAQTSSTQAYVGIIWIAFGD
jgi:hypothetical protein